MPTFDLTADQHAALKALRWLYDGSEDQRRTGRSTVLALSYLHRLLVNPGQWISIHDHHLTRMSGEFLGGIIIRLAKEAGIRSESIERRQYTGLELRFSQHSHVSRQTWAALTTFGLLDKIPGDLREPPDIDLTETTLWDHLSADGD